MSKKSNVDVGLALSYKFEPVTITYTEHDVILYALGVGEGKNFTDQKCLRFTYENHPNFSPLPTMAVVICSGLLGQVVSIPGLNINPMMLLHGEQYLEIRGPIPPAATLTSNAHVSSIYDKGRGALVNVDVTTFDQATGKEICWNQFSFFCRGIGGFGGDRGPAENAVPIPNRPPDAVHEEKTHPEQALLYRLTGDVNPLHADPEMAALGNFDRPILHGLCTFGFAGRAVLHHFCESEPSRFKAIRVRFSRHVFPGETIITEMWRVNPTRVVFQCRVKEREGIVLSNAYVELATPAKL